LKHVIILSNAFIDASLYKNSRKQNRSDMRLSNSNLRLKLSILLEQINLLSMIKTNNKRS